MVQRFKQVLTGDIELDEINDVTPLAYFTIEDKYEALSIFKDNGREGDLDMKRIRAHLNKVMFEASWNHRVDGARLEKKTEYANWSPAECDAMVVDGLFKLWNSYCIKIGLVDPKEVEKRQKEIEASKDVTSKK